MPIFFFISIFYVALVVLSQRHVFRASNAFHLREREISTQHRIEIAFHLYGYSLLNDILFNIGVYICRIQLTRVIKPQYLTEIA